MKKNLERLLFNATPLVLILLFISSGENIVPFIDKTFIAKYLYLISYPNKILFNLSVGYLSGIFIYYLTGYIPAKQRQKEQDSIALRLMKELSPLINGMFSMILKSSTIEKNNLENIDEEGLKEMCANCSLNAPSGYKKIISYSPLKTIDVPIRESLVNTWRKILTLLREIDILSVYIKPEYYDVCLKIKKCTLSLTIFEMEKPIKNNNLEAWSSQFFELYNLSKKLNNIIKLGETNKKMFSSTPI